MTATQQELRRQEQRLVRRRRRPRAPRNPGTVAADDEKDHDDGLGDRQQHLQRQDRKDGGGGGNRAADRGGGGARIARGKEHGRRRLPRQRAADDAAAGDAAKRTNLAVTASAAPATTPAPAMSFRVAKWSILRLLGAVYLFAFWGAYNQNEGLMGHDGLEPMSLQYVEESGFDSPLRGFLRHPTVLWWIPLADAGLSRLYLVGAALSLLAAAGGINSWLVQFVLWLLYLSIVTVAQLSNTFYSYGWESQLLETGFLAIFLCRLPSIEATGAGGGIGRFRLDLALAERRGEPPSAAVRWLYCWLMFRISMGAGLIKVRGSSCWRDRTCLHHHFETQPIPSPMSFAFHFLPRQVQSRMVDVDLLVQLYTSALVLVPVELVPPRWVPCSVVARWMLRAGGLLQVGFMVGILMSGNFAFLNHLTIVPGLACLDDGCFPRWLVAFVARPRRGGGATEKAPPSTPPNPPRGGPSSWLRPSRKWLDAVLLAVVGFLSLPVVANLLQLGGSRQAMNASFDPFRIVNTYGAFGSVGEARYEAILQVRNGTDWTELELPCKPGDVRRRPCFCAPYHYRLDWNIWFLGFKPHRGMLRQRESWMYSLIRKLLEEGKDKPRPWLNLLDSRSSGSLRERFYDRGSAPSMVKVDMYRYEMNKPLWGLVKDYWNGEEAVWWRRRFEESLIPPVVLDASGARLQLAPTD